MKDRHNTRALASVEDFERVKQKLVRKLRLWRMTVIAGAALAALVPAVVLADTQLTDTGLSGLPQQVQSLLTTVTTHSAQIASLQAGESSQNAQIALLQQQVQSQNAAIAALQGQLAAEIAARKQGDADTLSAANAHSDAAVAVEAARATGSEGALATSVAAVDTSATLNAAKLYTDGQIAIESAARLAADATLATNLSNETARATAGEQAAVGNAAGDVETTLTTIATAANGTTVSPQVFVDRIKSAEFFS